jgi:hypothetical protein
MILICLVATPNIKKLSTIYFQIKLFINFKKERKQMGSTTSYSSAAYKSFSDTIKDKPHTDLFSGDLKDSVKFTSKIMRECRSSDLFPNPRPIILMVDGTGSMGFVSAEIIKKLYKVPDIIHDNTTALQPSIAVGVIGDLHYKEKAPLQLSQFENDAESMIKSLQDLWLEGKGGGNNGEDYGLAYLAAANHTVFDYKGKGILFTMGDECYLPTLPFEGLNETFGFSFQKNLDVKELLVEAQKKYEVFHIVISKKANVSNGGEEEIKQWTDLLNERCLVIDDINALPDLIAVTVGLLSDIDRDKIFNNIDSSLLPTVRSASENLMNTYNNTDGILKI